MQADHGPAGRRPHLDEVAELVRDPVAEAAGAVRVGPAAADEGVVDRAAVGHLADEGPVLRPEPQVPGAAPVAEAVRRDLVDGRGEVGRLRARQAVVVRPLDDEGADRGERDAVEGEALGRRRRVRQRPAKASAIASGR